MNQATTAQLHTIRTYVRRGRATQAQKRALSTSGRQLLNPDIALADQWAFAHNRKLCVELGCGAGDNVLYMAERYPDYAFIAIDVYTPGMGRLLHRAQQQRLDNLCLIQSDLHQALAGCLAASKIDLCMVFFPDPWVKTRHHKRRLITQRFIDFVTPRIHPGGELWIATDWHNYAEQIIALMATRTDWLPTAEPPLCQRMSTAFEQKSTAARRQVFEQRWRMHNLGAERMGQ